MQGDLQWKTSQSQMIATRTFHNSLAIAFRRRRRGGPPTTSEKSESNLDGPMIVVRDPILFRQQAEILLDKLQQGLKPLMRYNDPFQLIRMKDSSIPGEYLTLDLGKEVVDGEFQILMDFGQQILVFSSPVSGQYSYQCMMAKNVPTLQKGDNGKDDTELSKQNTKEEEASWIDTSDGHAFVGMLVRDYIRVGKGVPKF